MRSSTGFSSFALCLALFPTVARAHTVARCSPAFHEAQARTALPAITVSGLAATTGAVAALASGEHGMVGTAYLLSFGFAPALVAFAFGTPCAADPTLSDATPPSAEQTREWHRGANGMALRIAVFHTLIAGSTILLSQNATSRTIAAVATGVAALSPLFYLDRFLDDGAPPAIALAPLPPQLTLRF